MKKKRFPEVADDHRVRRASGDRRQLKSSLKSGQRQRARPEHPRPRRWNQVVEFLSERLRHKEGDFGQSPGIQHLLQEITANRVGAILISDLSLSRDPYTVLVLLTACRQHHVLVVIAGRVPQGAS